MLRFSFSVKIKASKQSVWKKMKEFDNVALWTKSVDQSYYQGTDHAALGTTRVCKSPQFGTIVEKITAWTEGESYSYEADVAIAKYARNTWTVTEDGADCVLQITPESLIRFGPLGRLIELFVLKPQLKKQLPIVLAEFKYYAENDHPISEENKHKLELSAVYS